MTLKLRNIIMLILSTISAIGSCFIIFHVVFGFSIENTNISNAIPLVFLSIFSTIYCFSIYLFFRSTTSFEIFFCFIFVFSLIFDIFKLENHQGLIQNFISIYPMLPTRLIYYGRFAGALSLLCSGLFATGLEYQRIGTTALLSIILPAILVIVIPVDISMRIPGYTYKIGGYKEIFASISFIYIMAIFNYIIAGFKNENKDYFLIASILFFTILGREIVFYSNNLLIKTIGFLFLVSGSGFLSRRIHKLYLWY